MKLLYKLNQYKDRFFVAILLNSFAITSFAADEMDIVEDASGYIMKYLIGIAITILPIQVIFQIIQIKMGRKDPMEAISPIGWTALIVAVPPITTAVITLLQSHLGSNQL